MAADALRISFFVTPHGLGHATRACALMQALRRRHSNLRLRVYGQTPAWLFHECVGEIDYRPLATDVGVVQSTPLHEDLPATLERLAALLPFDSGLLDRLAAELADQDLVVCDIAPLGIAAARRARLPSVLVENFTWDWIYDGYREAIPALTPYAEQMRALFVEATRRIQATPVCSPWPGADRVMPIGRRPRRSPAQVRDALGISSDIPLLLVSMGGVPADYPWLARLERRDDLVCLIPGAAGDPGRRGSLLTPPSSEHYYPDLVNAADAVLCKVGYSTLAEAWHCGTPLAYITRPRFRESGVLADFIARHIPSLKLTPEDWEGGGWIGRIPEILALPRAPTPRFDGADQAASIILEA
jgi:UDP:flavonoid glycosyltransferase YjiC (YdhE family)